MKISDNHYNAIMWWRDLDYDSQYYKSLDHYKKRPYDLKDQEIINIYNKEQSNANKGCLILIGSIIFIILACWLILKTKP